MSDELLKIKAYLVYGMLNPKFTSKSHEMIDESIPITEMVEAAYKERYGTELEDIEVYKRIKEVDVLFSPCYNEEGARVLYIPESKIETCNIISEFQYQYMNDWNIRLAKACALLEVEFPTPIASYYFFIDKEYNG
jgi:hypothetical protein